MAESADWARSSSRARSTARTSLAEIERRTGLTFLRRCRQLGRLTSSGERRICIQPTLHTRAASCSGISREATDESSWRARSSSLTIASSGKSCILTFSCCTAPEPAAVPEPPPSPARASSLRRFPRGKAGDIAQDRAQPTPDLPPLTESAPPRKNGSSKPKN